MKEAAIQVIEFLLDNDILKEEDISKAYYHFLSERDYNSSKIFFQQMVKVRPQSYELRRCYAESLMASSEYEEASLEWLYIIDTLKMANINVYYRYFNCCLVLRKTDELESIIKKMERIQADADVTIKARDLFLSYYNERYEVSLRFMGKEGGSIPACLQDCSQKRYLKRRESYDIKVPSIGGDISNFADVNMRNGLLVRIYPQIIDFSLVFPLAQIMDAVEVTLHLGGVTYIAEISSRKIIGVLEGKEGWLFLANDSNLSIEQYLGKRLIYKEDLQGWQRYLQSACLLNEFILFVAPSKESVFPCFYPFQRSNERSIDQLKNLVENQHFNRFCYPVDQLARDERSYSKTETHFTYYGAGVCFSELAKRYLRLSEAEMSGANFEYISRKNVGDLGSKLNPVRESEFLFIKDDPTPSRLCYCNGLDFTGRVAYYRNDSPQVKRGKVLLFGDSFSTFIIPFFVGCFSEVLLCRNGGSVYMDMVERYKPDFIVSEITERFIVKNPVVWGVNDRFKPLLKYEPEKLFSAT